MPEWEGAKEENEREKETGGRKRGKRRDVDVRNGREMVAGSTRKGSEKRPPHFVLRPSSGRSIGQSPSPALKGERKGGRADTLSVKYIHPHACVSL